jgi:N-acetylglucosamine-6-phosphate deacetylase
VTRHEIVIDGGRVLTSQGLVDASIGVSKGRIEAFGDELAGDQVVNAAGRLVLAGFIDLHIHGAAGAEVLGGPDALKGVATYLPSGGTTAFFPTAATAPMDRLLGFLGDVAELSGSDWHGAELLGSHLEGPYLNPARKGAQAVEHMRPFNLEEARELVDRSRGTLRHLTLAPEIEGGRQLTEALRASGVTVAAGHSDATYEQAMEAFSWGVTHVTHTFNAMRPLHHRDPGLIAAAMAAKEITCEVIADTVHVHGGAIRALVEAKGSPRTAVVTDGLPMLGQPPGRYQWLQRPVVVDERAAWLEDGGLCGSITPLDAALRNLLSLGFSLADAGQMLSATPASIARVADRKGALKPGYDADLVILDESYRVVATYCRGRLAYSATASE